MARLPGPLAGAGASRPTTAVTSVSVLKGKAPGREAETQPASTRLAIGLPFLGSHPALRKRHGEVPVPSLLYQILHLAFCVEHVCCWSLLGAPLFLFSCCHKGKGEAAVVQKGKWSNSFLTDKFRTAELLTFHKGSKRWQSNRAGNVYH